MNVVLKSKPEYQESHRADIHTASDLHVVEVSEADGFEVLAPPQNAPAVRILIADVGTIFRESLSFVLQSRQGFQVVGSCADGESVLALAPRSSPDVLLLDSCIAHSEGVDMLHEVKNLGLDMKVVLLCPLASREEVVAALRLGVRGIFLKSEPTDMLVQCIQKVARGEYWLSRDSVADLVNTVCGGGDGKPLRESKYGLTPREGEIISAVLEGYSNPEIAASLSLSEHTVKHHLSNIFDKLGVYSRLELALFAVNHSIDSK
jgi:two-component system, NarL family, nitrate/nitrite response regulator NarL